MDSPIINSFLEADFRIVNPIVDWFCIDGDNVRCFTYSENNGGWTEIINTESAAPLSEGQPFTDAEATDVVHPGHANVHPDGLRMHPAPARCAPAKTTDAFDDGEWANFDPSEEVWAILDNISESGMEPLLPMDDEAIALQIENPSEKFLAWIKGKLEKKDE
jgi:hypothetical protein